MSQPKKTKYPNMQWKELGNWLDFSLGYLKASELCANDFLAYCSEDDSDTKRGTYPHRQFLFIPAIWNFKHAFEIMTKYLHKKSGKQGKLNHHKLSQLMNEIPTTIDQDDKNSFIDLATKYIEFDAFKKIIQPKIRIADNENQLFHYPDGHAEKIYEVGDDLYFGMFLSDPNKPELIKFIEIMLKDIQTAVKLFSNMVSQNKPKK